MGSISAEAQIRYIIQWFNEWSELQRSDFLPILAEKYSNKVYVNGIVDHISSLNCQDKPMSLFECRVKLFKEWFVQWTSEQREGFLKNLSDIDPVYAEKLNGELQNGLVNGVGELQNGLVNGVGELQNGNGNDENHNHNGEEVLED